LRHRPDRPGSQTALFVPGNHIVVYAGGPVLRGCYKTGVSVRLPTIEAASLRENGRATEPDFIAELLPALGRLDARLELAVDAAQALFNAEAASDRYRGLYVSEDEVRQLLARPPVEPLFGVRDDLDSVADSSLYPKGSRLSWLRNTYGLSAFELDVLLLALAPELDRRYERLYAYLQDHVARHHPTVDLVLNLLSEDAVARLQRRVDFDPDAPLLRHGLIHLRSDQEQLSQSLLAQMIYVDEQVLRFLLHHDNLDRRLASSCQVMLPVPDQQGADVPLIDPVSASMALRSCEEGTALSIYLWGPVGIGKRQTAVAVAKYCGRPLVKVQLESAPTNPVEFDGWLRLIFRYARFYGALLFFDGLHHIQRDKGEELASRLYNQLAECSGVVILSGTQRWYAQTQKPLGVLIVSMPMPDFAQRRACWKGNVLAAGIDLEDDALDFLAGRFRLTPAQIAEAVTLAGLHVRRQVSDNLPLAPGWSLDTLVRSARAQSGHELEALAQKIVPRYLWDDIVLPDDAMQQLLEICQRVAYRQRVLGEWGFGHKLALGKGVNVLFAGPSGAGKTMAAEIVANELGLDLFKIDLSTVVSKYIGETEKNLSQVFSAAENANAILFFDEADALFGKRSEVSDSHDRYANIEISYLLQKMEEYDGIAILATNLRQNLDDAFIRRLAFLIHFPFPDEASRLRIWNGAFPKATPLAEDLDLAYMARQFKVTGGNIRNIALAAAFLAADKASPIGMAHLLRATVREYQKLGKILGDTELSAVQQFGDI
jgi:hypothetical protein